ncbi:MAG: hypothetical protein H0V70_25830 [Ktedonobacteraceae bacterium]|nr:hypothetical protein [Ktedonobacteraceae bacterium]
MSPYKIGLPASYQTPEDRILHGLSAEQRQRAFWYELEGFGHLSFVADLLRSNDPIDQEIVRDWEAIWLIRNHGILWAWGYTKEHRGKMQDALEALRASGRYTLEFRLYDLCCGDD